jgi:DHA1 family multidrug resistance protein-like MFS transporter
LPLMPALVENLVGDEASRVASHTGWLTAAFTLGLFVFSPIWGSLADRVDGRAVIGVGLVGGGAALWALDLPLGLVELYLLRILAGAMSAAVLPGVFSYATQSWPLRKQERFGWIASATSVGFLLGPVVGNALGNMTRGLAGRPMADSPFAVVAYLSFAAAAAVLALPGQSRSRVAGETVGRAGEAQLRRCLVQAAVVALAITVAEVGLTLLSRQGGVVRPAYVTFYFGVCSATMVAMQVWAYPRLEKRFGEPRTVGAALACLSAGLALLALPPSIGLIALAFVLGGSAVGVLIPALSVRVASGAGTRPGWGLGRQSSAANLGQSLGAALTGMLYALSPPLPFAAAALAVAVVAIAEWGAPSIPSRP